MNTPKVSVAMTCYNEPWQWIKGAVDSILNQTLQDIEYNIVIDQPDYPHERELRDYVKNDHRVHIITLTENKGIGRAKQKAIDMCTAPYIALMDADDQSLPHRLETQLKFLEDNPDIDFCSSHVETFGYKNVVYRFPIKHEEFALYLDSSIACPTVMFRRSVMDNEPFFFDPEYKYSEDYEAWTRFYPKHRFETIPEVLLRYRKSTTQVTKSKRDLVQKYTCQPRLNILNYYLEREGIQKASTPLTIDDIIRVSGAKSFPDKHKGDLIYQMLVSIPDLKLSDVVSLYKAGHLQFFSRRNYRRLFKHLIGLKRKPFFPQS